MLFKMLRIETAWAGSVDLPKPRQLFVTQSRVLAGKVEEYFSKLMESFVTASHTPRELSKLAQTKHTQQEEKPLLDMDDVMNWRDDLPERFSLLEDSHFPLFITFDKVRSQVSVWQVLTSQLYNSFANCSRRTLLIQKLSRGTWSMLRYSTTT